MMNLRKNEHLLLSIIFKANKKIDSFTLFKRSRMNFPSFSRKISLLVEKELITEDGDKIVLTKNGIKITSLYKTSYTTTGAEWRKVPIEIKGRKLDKNEFYIPSTRLLDKKTFHSLHVNIE